MRPAISASTHLLKTEVNQNRNHADNYAHLQGSVEQFIDELK